MITFTGASIRFLVNVWQTPRFAAGLARA